MQPIIRAELVYISIPAGGGGAGGSQPFPRNADLDDTFICGIEAFDVTMLAADPNRIPIISAADSLNVLVTLNDNADQRVKQAPLTSLIAQLNNGVWKEYLPFNVSYKKSKVEFVGAVAASTSIPFMVYYYRPDDRSKYFDRRTP